MGYYWSPLWSLTASSATADIRGRPLRYLLVTLLADAHQPLTIKDLIRECEAEGLRLTARPSKVISDALRWEVRAGRVKRLARGIYALNRVPGSTMRWIGHRVAQLRYWLQWVHSRDRQSFAFEPVLDNPSLWHWQAVSWVPGWPRWPKPPGTRPG